MLQNESAEGKKEALFAGSFDFTVRLVQLELRGTWTVSSLLARLVKRLVWARLPLNYCIL